MREQHLVQLSITIDDVSNGTGNDHTQRTRMNRHWEGMRWARNSERGYSVYLQRIVFVFISPSGAIHPA